VSHGPDFIRDSFRQFCPSCVNSQFRGLKGLNEPYDEHFRRFRLSPIGVCSFHGHFSGDPELESLCSKYHVRRGELLGFRSKPCIQIQKTMGWRFELNETCSSPG
jgi:hypothetical protein